MYSKQTNLKGAPYRGKKVGEKWLDFLQVTKFFPNEIFPQLSLSQPVFFPEFFSSDKEFIPIFFFFFFFNDIHTTRNCTFVNFENYTTLKTSKRIGFKLVLIISRSKERVFNSFKDFVWFFDRLCYPFWFKPFKTKSLRPRKYSYIS